MRGMLQRLRFAPRILPDRRDEAVAVLDDVERRLAADGTERNPIARAFLMGGLTTMQALNARGRRP
jgi:hypothetical protein